jgi:uncharacterized protein with NRDE domain
MERKKEEKDTWRGVKTGGKILKTRNKRRKNIKKGEKETSRGRKQDKMEKAKR